MKSNSKKARGRAKEEKLLEPPEPVRVQGSRPRHLARADALKVLYQLEVNNGLSPRRAMGYFEQCFHEEGIADAFTERLVLGVSEELATLDTLLNSISQNWRTDRMARVDRTILRLGAYELQFCDDIPATVTIDEMVELAKQFGSEDSPSFINGILDRVKAQLDRPQKAP